MYQPDLQPYINRADSSFASDRNSTSEYVIKDGKTQIEHRELDPHILTKEEVEEGDGGNCCRYIDQIHKEVFIVTKLDIFSDT